MALPLVWPPRAAYSTAHGDVVDLARKNQTSAECAAAFERLFSERQSRRTVSFRQPLSGSALARRCKDDDVVLARVIQQRACPLVEHVGVEALVAQRCDAP